MSSPLGWGDCHGNRGGSGAAGRGAGAGHVYGVRGIGGGGGGYDDSGGGGDVLSGGYGGGGLLSMPPLVFLKYFVLFLVLVYCVFRLLRFPKVRRLVIFYITKYKIIFTILYFLVREICKQLFCFNTYS
jgi:hypothetical protein